jgi:tRNA G18 (ribose-2'-O)-methylase SpoU
MFHVQRIDTLERPELAAYRTMRRQTEHRQEGIFVAESDKVVHRLLESQCTVVSLLIPEKWLKPFEQLLAARPENIAVYILEKDELEKLTGFTFYQGVLAVGKVPPAPRLESVLDQSSSPKLFAAVEGLTNAENLGGLVRNCVGFGVQGVLVNERCASPYLRRAVRSSMGTVFRIPMVENLQLEHAIKVLKHADVQCIAAHPHAQGHSLHDIDLTSDTCIVFGSEGYGLTPGVVAACSTAVAIPMAPGVDSLNVGSAAAVFLYETARQRNRLSPSSHNLSQNSRIQRP